MRLNYAIVHVSDMKRSVVFYRDIIGLPLRFDSPGWTEFDTDGATLALHESKESPVREKNPGQIPPGQCRPGLGVADLEEFHKRMMANQVTCLQPPTETFGARVAQYVDPDGLSISVAEERKNPQIR